MKIKANAHNNVLVDHDRTYTTCAIIGNSGILNKTDHGDFIDSHDCVVRMNAAKVKGYEDKVGSKTTYRTVNGLLQKGKTLKYTTTPSKWLSRVQNENIIYVPVSDRSEQIANSLIDKTANVIKVSRKFKDYIKDDVRKELGRYPSSGLFTCLLFSCICDEISLFGFGFHREELELRHYWEEWTDSHDASHKWEKEEEILKSFCKTSQFEIIK